MSARALLILAVIAAVALLAAPEPARAAPAPGAVLWSDAPLYDGALYDLWEFARPGADGSLFVAGLHGQSPTDPFTGGAGVMRIAADGTVLWSKTWSGTGLFAAPCGIAVDSRNNVYVVVTQYYQAMPSWSSDLLLLKYSPSGSLRWTEVFAGPPDLPDGAAAVEVGPTGDVYIAATMSSAGTGPDIVVFRVTPSGDLRYRTTYRGARRDGATDLALDERGNAYVAGFTSLVADEYWPFLVKIGATGARKWTRRLDSVDSTFATVQVRAGAMYAAGESAPGQVFCAKYSLGGSRRWVRRWSAGEGVQHLGDLAVDSRGAAYMTAYAVPVVAPPYPPHFLLKWDASGKLQWKRTGVQLFPALGASLVSLCVDSNDRVFVGGSVYDPGSGDTDAFVARFTTTGRAVWRTRWDGADHRGDAVQELASGRLANGRSVIYAAGSSHWGGPSLRDPLVLRLQP